MHKKKIALVGAGPKSIAIAAKAHILRQHQVIDIDAVIIEDTDVAANWDGEHGFTDGGFRLGTPPEKDIGFPYTSAFGRVIDRDLFRYSWQSYLVDKGRFGGYVDRGKPHPSHNVWARYLRWVLKQMDFKPVTARVIGFDTLSPEVGITVTTLADGKSEQSRFDGIVFTGPGSPTRIAGSNHEWSEHIVDGRQFWQRVALFRELSGRSKEIAIIGGGETAASIAVCLINEAPGLSVHIVNRHGTLYTRGEGFHENNLYTDPSQWTNLDEADREDFIRRTDRGVFSAESKKTIDYSDNIRIITGNVLNVAHKGKTVVVDIRRGKGRTVQYTYDRVIIATGFDPFCPLELLPNHKRARYATTETGAKVDLFKELRRRIDYHLRIPVPFDSPGIQNVHMPMLSALTQGPGFPNLSCLGTLSDRVLSTYLSTEEKAKFLAQTVRDVE